MISDSLIFYEEELFNDLYSFNSYEGGIGITHYFTDELKLSSELRYNKRQFTSLYSADLDGNELDELREDNQIGFGLGLEYDLTELIDGLGVSASWNYIRNQSNDEFYKYSNQIYSFSISYGF